MSLRVVEICAGGGGQALGLEQAGWEHVAVTDNDPDACATLRHNRPDWKVIEGDIRQLDGRQFAGADLLAGGVPCPPFSVASQQLGADDERNLFPQAIRLVGEIMPRAVLLENVRGLAEPKFSSYVQWISDELWKLGYAPSWKLINAYWYGVPQLRPRYVMIAFYRSAMIDFHWKFDYQPSTTAGLAIYDLMKERGWPGAATWALERCNKIAPTIVGGSKKHGGPDLGPTRARAQWKALGVEGISLANEAPGPDEPMDYTPRLTIPMVARLQGFPDGWEFMGNKTARYRQVGNAFPPPVARGLGLAIAKAQR